MARKKGLKQSWPTEPFVAVLKHTLKAPAWLDLTFGARCLYVLLKAYHNGQNNGSIRLGVRRAAAELNASRSSVEKWFRELEEHGFIRPTQRAYLGAEGKANATCWRLTELGYLGQQPTREYRAWQPSKSRIPHHFSGQTVPKRMTPRPEKEDNRPEKEDGFEENEAPERPDFRCKYIIPHRGAA
ncbi:hypothetical protein [Rhodoligotrophos ferricapiens]|uniref:hypothetical protein n=1 Tax=Rhodoligotrophos ferricapiens TaxID=3069264 RepID=UPI00315C7413